MRFLPNLQSSLAGIILLVDTLLKHQYPLPAVCRLEVHDEDKSTYDTRTSRL